jgi:hypothetical protein
MEADEEAREFARRHGFLGGYVELAKATEGDDPPTLVWFRYKHAITNLAKHGNDNLAHHATPEAGLTFGLVSSR